MSRLRAFWGSILLRILTEILSKNLASGVSEGDIGLIEYFIDGNGKGSPGL